MWQRAVLFVAALCLIVPELISSLLGLALLGAVGGAQVISRRASVATVNPRAK